MSALEAVTFGCRLNIVETAEMVRLAGASGVADATLVNTCAVTAGATRQSKQAVRRALRERLDASIIVTGCAASIEAQAFAALGDRVSLLPNSAKTDARAWAALAGPGLAPATVSAPVRAHTRGFVAVQTGCDHRCTFCVIPLGRGPSRSTPAATIIERVRELAAGGVSDVTLTGVDLTAWGADLPDAPRLGDLVRAILRGVPDLPRLRLSSLDCIEADDALLRAVAEEERLMPHLHLSLQAGDDLVLKRMKRRHGRRDAVRFCDALRRARPGMVFGADLIAGFPTESAEQFGRTLSLAEECGLTHLHVFSYSARPDTPAARMPQVPGPVVAERAARLRAEGERRLSLHLDAQVGARLDVLVERGAVGRARDFTPVRVPPLLEPGAFAEVDVAGHHDGRLVAQGA